MTMFAHSRRPCYDVSCCFHAWIDRFISSRYKFTKATQYSILVCVFHAAQPDALTSDLWDWCCAQHRFERTICSSPWSSCILRTIGRRHQPYSLVLQDVTFIVTLIESTRVRVIMGSWVRRGQESAVSRVRLPNSYGKQFPFTGP